MPSRPCTPRLRPCIAELLRTRVQPRSLLLRIEKVIIEEASYFGSYEAKLKDEDEHAQRRAYRLWLSDGEIVIQAVLAGHLHPIFESDATSEGSLLDLKRFKVQRGKRKHGAGEVVYLAIADYDVAISAKPATPSAIDLDNEGGFIREQSQTPPTKKRGLSSPESGMARVFPPPVAMHTITSSQESDCFEDAQVDKEALGRRRQALHELSNNLHPTKTAKIERDHTESPRKRRRLLDRNDASTAIHLPAQSQGIDHAHITEPKQHHSIPPVKTSFAKSPIQPSSAHSRPSSSGSASMRLPALDEGKSKPSPSPAPPPSEPPQTQSAPPPPLHTLNSLLHPPSHSPLPSRNYLCSVFAIITWVSPTLLYPRPNSPFPPKRHIKIHDSSIASRYAGITLAVYDNAANFKPVVGTMGLFRGVVMQRWEGEVILNAYARKRIEKEKEKERDGKEDWFICDEERLGGMGFDIVRMKQWWEEWRRGKGKGTDQALREELGGRQNGKNDD